MMMMMISKRMQLGTSIMITAVMMIRFLHANTLNARLLLTALMLLLLMMLLILLFDMDINYTSTITTTTTTSEPQLH